MALIKRRPNITLVTCIDAQFNIDVSQLHKLISDHTVVIIEQHALSDVPEFYNVCDKVIKFIAYSRYGLWTKFDSYPFGNSTYVPRKTFNDCIDEALTTSEDVVIIGDEITIMQAIICPYVTHIRLVSDHNSEYVELMGVLPKQKEFGKLFPRFIEDKFDQTISLENKAELRYLAMLQRMIDAPERPNRTATGTRGVFHEYIEFDLSDIGGRILPLLTTKKVPEVSVVEELKMFIHGETTNERLKEKNIKIWDGNSTREYLDSIGLTDYPEGTLGPIYGAQWRSFGGSGIDQLQKAIDTLITNPGDRRMLVTAWNPIDIPKMVLPACHFSFQFHCDFIKLPDGSFKPSALNCLVNMRSADTGLGVPFNIASYAFLTHFVSLITGIPPGKLGLVLADCHIYTDHITGIKKQLLRQPKRFPYIKFMSELKSIDDIDDLKFIIVGYKPDPYIKLDMAV